MLGSDKGMLMDALGALTRSQAEQHGGTPTLQAYNKGITQIIATIKNKQIQLLTHLIVYF